MKSLKEKLYHLSKTDKERIFIVNKKRLIELYRENLHAHSYYLTETETEKEYLDINDEEIWELNKYKWFKMFGNSVLIYEETNEPGILVCINYKDTITEHIKRTKEIIGDELKESIEKCLL